MHFNDFLNGGLKLVREYYISYCFERYEIYPVLDLDWLHDPPTREVLYYTSQLNKALTRVNNKVMQFTFLMELVGLGCLTSSCKLLAISTVPAVGITFTYLTRMTPSS